VTQELRETSQENDDVERRFDDELWKEIIGKFFHPMLRSALPKLAKDADVSKPVVFLETELRRLARFTRRYSQSPPDSRKFVDILAVVPLLSGADKWVLLHVEIQGRGGREDFPLRMHRYRCLLEGRYNRSVVGMAIIVQQIPADQGQGEYHWEEYDCEVIYRYPVVKIYEGDDRALRESDNPFDLAHYAGMQAWKERGNDARKLDYMKILLAELDRRQWSHEEKMTLLWFIEGIMHIQDRNLSEEWEEELEGRKEEGDVYVSLLERKGMEKGMEKGRMEGLEKGLEKGKIEVARAMLADGEPEAKILRYARITPEQLRKIREGASSFDC